MGGGGELRNEDGLCASDGLPALLVIFMIIPLKDAAKVLFSVRMTKGGPDPSLLAGPGAI